MRVQRAAAIVLSPRGSSGLGGRASARTQGEPEPDPAAFAASRHDDAGARQPPVRLYANVNLGQDFQRPEDKADLLLDGNQNDGLLTRLRFGDRVKGHKATVSGGLRFSAGETPNPASPFIRLGDAFRPVNFNLDQFYIDVRPFQNKSASTASSARCRCRSGGGTEASYARR